MHAEGAALGPEDWLAWVQHLLGSEPQKYQRKGLAAGRQQWQPSTAQVKVLLATAMSPGNLNAAENSGEPQPACRILLLLAVEGN